jgi:single-stranded-DNA-specific exonuclease
MPPTKRWLTASPAPPEHLRRYRGMSTTIAQILYNRGFTDPDAAYNFLYADDPTVGAVLSYKGKKPPIDKALARIRQAIRGREPIVVYGDFDADGVTSTALLVQVLAALGANVKAYIPHRIDEGYGLNSEALLKLKRGGARLVITVDCGIRSVQEAEDARAEGLDLIITDHHTPGAEVPNALAVINPKLDDCPYTEDMLAGVGVAFRLAEALLTISTQISRSGSIPPLKISDLYDLVAIGTVADLAPLNRLENRALVKRGLVLINEMKRPGVRALAEVAGLKSGSIGADSIGYALGPRINAAGRLDTAMTAYHLLSTSDAGEATKIAQQLQELNVRRQELTRAAQDLVRGQLDASDGLPLIFAADTGFLPGIVGLVAGRLSEEFFRPAVVMELGESESRASCRSIPQFDITHALDQCASLLVRHGGHAQAAGFTVINENIPALKEKLMGIARSALRGQELLPTLDIDLELEASQISLDLIAELQQLEPTGHSNPTPTFMTRNLRLMECRTVGRDEQHLKLKLARPNQPPLDAIGFNLGELGARLTDRVDVAYQLEVNEWNGNRSAQLRLLDVRSAGGL